MMVQFQLTNKSFLFFFNLDDDFFSYEDYEFEQLNDDKLMRKPLNLDVSSYFVDGFFVCPNENCDRKWVLLI